MKTYQAISKSVFFSSIAKMPTAWKNLHRIIRRKIRRFQVEDVCFDPKRVRQLRNKWKNQREKQIITEKRINKRPIRYTVVNHGKIISGRESWYKAPPKAKPLSFVYDEYKRTYTQGI